MTSSHTFVTSDAVHNLCGSMDWMSCHQDNSPTDSLLTRIEFSGKMATLHTFLTILFSAKIKIFGKMTSPNTFVTFDAVHGLCRSMEWMFCHQDNPPTGSLLPRIEFSGKMASLHTFSTSDKFFSAKIKFFGEMASLNTFVTSDAVHDLRGTMERMSCHQDNPPTGSLLPRIEFSDKMASLHTFSTSDKFIFSQIKFLGKMTSPITLLSLSTPFMTYVGPWSGCLATSTTGRQIH